MKLFKSKSGVVIDEKFVDLDGWAVTDPPSVTIDDGLNISPTADKSVVVSRNIQSDVQSYVAMIDYTPVLEGDAGGLALFNNSDEAVELLEFANGVNGTLEEIRVTRNGNDWTFEMKRNGVYEHVDSFEYPFFNIGFIRKPTLNGAPFKVSRFIGVKSRKLRINQLPEDSIVKLEFDNDIAEKVAGEDEYVEFELEDNVVEARITVESDGDLFVDVTGEFFGGDVYSFGTFLEMLHNDEALDEFEPQKLGRVTTDGLLVQLDLFNPSELAAVAVTLQPLQYNSETGYERTDVSNNEVGPFSKSLKFNRIEPNESYPFWIKISQEGIVPENNLIYFSIQVEHS